MKIRDNWGGKLRIMFRHKNKTLEYSFYLFVFLLPWQTVFLLREVFISGEKWQYGTVGIYVSDIILIIFLALFLIKKYNLPFCHPRGNGDPVQKPKDLRLDSRLRGNDKSGDLRFIFLTFIIWSFLSILWSPDKILAFYFSLKLLLAAGLFLVAKSASWRIDWKKMVFVLALAGALQGVLAIGQFLAQQDFANTIFGTSRHEIFAGGTSVIENESGRWLRAYGTFPHPNILGGYLAIILLILIWRQEERRKKKEESKFEIQNYSYFLLLTSYFLIFSGLILSFSRAAWLAFAIGLFLIFLVEKEKRKELGKILFIFLLTLLIWASAFSPLFFSRFSGETRLEQKSISDRTEYVLQAKEIIKNNFWLGAGAGNYTKEVFQNNPQKPIWQIQPVHNVFLLIFAELGIIGLLLFFAIIILIAITFLKNIPASLFILSSLFLLLIFDHWLWTSHFGILFFFLMMGVAIKENYNSEKIL